MPWDAKSFASKHNHKLSGKAADTAARQATAMVKKGVPEGEAIATANKTGNRVGGYADGGKVKTFPLPSSPAPSGGERRPDDPPGPVYRPFPDEGGGEGQRQASFASGGSVSCGSTRYMKK